MLLKLTSSTKLLVFISVSALWVSQITAFSSVKGGSTSTSSKLTSSSHLSTSGSASSGSTVGNKQFQVTTAFATSSEPSVLNYGTRINPFRDTLKIKSKQVLSEATGNAIATGGGSLPSGYSYGPGGSIYRQTRPVTVDEALPEVNLESSLENTSVEQSDRVATSEEFQSSLGTETTSVQPNFEDDGPASTAAPFVTAAVIQSRHKSTGVKHQEHAQEIETETELIHTNRVSSGKPPKRIQAAVKTRHTFEYRPVVLDHLQEEIEPKIIEVAAKSVPLEIHFKSASSRIKLVQSHKSGELKDEIQRTTSNEEPQRLIHLVRKPIIQEVREIITPYRRIVQEIEPVMEEIHTIVTHEKEGRVHGKLTQKKQQQTSSTSTSSSSSSSSSSSQSQTQKKSQTHSTQHEQKVEQKRIPAEWLRPIQNQITSTSQSKQQQQQKVEQTRIEQSSGKQQISQQKINQNGYGPAFNTYPIEVTSARPQVVQNDDNDETSEVEDIDNQSIEVVDGNDLNALIPARVMEQIIHDYQVRVQNKAQSQQQQQSHQQSQQQSQQQRRPQPTPTKGQGNFNQQRPTQQLREAASVRNWQAIRPYVYYGPQNNQFRGPAFNNQQQQQQGFHHSANNQNNGNNGYNNNNRY